jgi:uncharacterized protein YkwD
MGAMKSFRTLLIPATAVLLFLLLGVPAAAQANCDHSGDPIRSITKKNARAAIGCLFNKERSAKNVKRVGNLTEAAQGHSKVMARQGCLSHQCSGEPNLPERVSRTGYLRGSSNYKLGEIIIAGPAKSTSRQVVSRWVNSSGHRAVLMDSAFDHVGVGLAMRNGSVYVTGDFGSN